MAKFTSLLSDPDFLEQALTRDTRADALNSPGFVEAAVVADRRGNDIAAIGSYINDLKTMSYWELDQKYGRKVADDSDNIQIEVERQYELLNNDRSTLSMFGESSLDATAAITGFVGGGVAAVGGIIGGVTELVDSDSTEVSQASTYIAEKTAQLGDWITSFQGSRIKERHELNAIAADLDQDDINAAYHDDIAAGSSVMIAEFTRSGREAMAYSERISEDSMIATSTIAGALGSIIPSAKVAQLGALLTKALVKAKTKRGAVIASSLGGAVGIGVGESSGVYLETSNFVMGLTEEEMGGAPEYNSLRARGRSHEDAQRITAASVATEAAGRQLPVAATLGLIGARFNINPIKVFKGKGVVGIFKEIGKQIFEEGGQGGSATLSRGFAIQSQIDENFDVGEGFGAATAEGAFAGAGMSSVLAAPGAARATAGATIRGAISGVSTAATIAGSVGAGTLDTISSVAKKAADVASPVTGPVVAAAKTATAAASAVASPYVEAATGKLKDFADRPNKKLLAESVASAARAVELDPENTVVKAVSDVITGLIETGASKMTDDQILSASNAIISLRKEVKGYSPDLQSEALKMLSSAEFSKIRKRYATIKAETAAATNLNDTQNETTEVTPETVQETLDVSRTNPTNVNPGHIKKVLEQRERFGLTEQDVEDLKLSSELATALNTHRDVVVEISSDESAALSVKPAYNGKPAPAITAREATSASVQLTGFKNAQGKDLRSIAGFASDIMTGIRSEDGTVADVNEDEGFIEVQDLIDNFGKLVTHFKNKVGALNESFANADRDGTGPKVKFESIVDGTRLVPAGGPGGAVSVWYNRNSPNSVATAQRVHNDAVVAAKVYNTMAKAHPDKFPGGEITIPDLAKAEVTPTTTAAEADGGKSLSETEGTSEAQAKEDPKVEGEDFSASTEQTKTKEKEKPLSPEEAMNAKDKKNRNRELEPGKPVGKMTDTELKNDIGYIQELNKDPNHSFLHPLQVATRLEELLNEREKRQSDEAMSRLEDGETDDEAGLEEHLASQEADEDILSPEVVSEVNDLVTMMNLMRIPVEEGVTVVPDTKTLQENIKDLMTIFNRLKKDPDPKLSDYIGRIKKMMSWVKSDIVQDNKTREVRAKKNAAKLGGKSYVLQMAEELIEVIEAHDSNADTQALEIQKRELKLLRFGPDTVIKQEGPYKGLTNQEALDKAKGKGPTDAEREAEFQADVAVAKEVEDTKNSVIQRFINRLKGKATKVVVDNNIGPLAIYRKADNTIRINMTKVEADFNAGLTYIQGEVAGATSAQKAEVFKNIDIEAFKAFIKEGGLDRYVEFILEHELEHARQLTRGEVYPRTKDGRADLMNAAAIEMERAANAAGFKAIGFETTAVDEVGTPDSSNWILYDGHPGEIPDGLYREETKVPPKPTELLKKDPITLTDAELEIVYDYLAIQTSADEFHGENFPDGLMPDNTVAWSKKRGYSARSIAIFEEWLEVANEYIAREGVDNAQGRQLWLQKEAQTGKRITNENTTAVDEAISPQAQISEEADQGEDEVQNQKQSLKDIFQLGESTEIADAQMEAEIRTKMEKVLSKYLSKETIQFMLENVKGFFSILDENISGAVHDSGGLHMLGLQHSIMQDFLYKTLSKEDLHTLLHEVGHVIDNVYLKTIISDEGRVTREWYQDNKFVKEINLYILHDENQASKLSEFLTNYALKQSNPHKVKSELFAELFALATKDMEKLKNELPETAKFFEEFLKRINEETRNSFGSKGSGQESSLVTSPVTKKFGETFSKNKKELDYKGGVDIIRNLEVGTNTTKEYVDFARKVYTKLVRGLNERLNTVLVSKKDGRTVGDAVRAGEDLTNIRDFKNTMMVDPKTGQYDPALLGIAAVAIIDWLSSVKTPNLNNTQINQTLKALGFLQRSELNNEDYLNIINGVSPRQASETLAKTIMRMWGVQVKGESQMVDARGAVEGLMKEAFIVLDQKFDFVTLIKIPTMVGKGKNKKPGKDTWTLNVKGLRKDQIKIGLDGQDSVQKLLAPEENRGPSFGEKIPTTPSRNQRGSAKNTKTERAALKTQQDTPHYLAKGISGFIGTMGYEVYKKMSGWRSVDHLAKNHPLRNSIEGKNLSIERDWDDAHAVTEVLQGDNQETPVYFNIGITRVGRHQHSGINVQQNKTLRVMVSPTAETLDMTNQDHNDGFWLTVAQSSGLFKVEDIFHEEILSKIQGAFTKEFGDAVKLIEGYLKTDKLDENALFKATGEITMEQLNSIFAVASLNVVSSKTNALTEFHTTLGFEMDGKTDGPAHMMNNFGQGLMSREEFTNFQRVGLFLGTKLETLNSFFSRGNVDLYNKASTTGMRMLYSAMASSGPAMKEALYASARFAEKFGDFEIGPDGLPEMTRTTAKNPMTKTVYGAGLYGVARGISEDMVLEFYERIINVPEGADASEYLAYPDLEADFRLLFGAPFPKGVNWATHYLDKKSMDNFADIIIEGIGEMIATAAKEVIGVPITRVNDTLVYITNVQTEFQVLLYNKRLLELAEQRALEGKVGRNKQGVAIVRELSVNDFKALADEIGAYGPTYSNGAQTLAIGSMESNPSKQKLSSAMDGNFDNDSNMSIPAIANVKAIPYLTQGRGDAMVINTIYSGRDAPTDTVAVHDGIYVPISKIKEYSKLFNEAVMKVWDRDVLGDVVTDFEGFLGKVEGNQDLLIAAMAKVEALPYTTSVEVKTAAELMNNLKEMHRQNQARKKVFRKIPMSVDHLGGAQTAATRGPDTVMDHNDINDLIADELNQKRPTPIKADLASRLDDERTANEATIRSTAAAGLRTAQNETLIEKAREAAIERAAKKDKTEIVVEETPKGEPNILITDTKTLMEDLVKKSNRRSIRKTIQILTVLLASKNFKVVIGKTAEDVKKHFKDQNGFDLPISGNLVSTKGFVDMANNTMYLLSTNHETLTHELIHIATFEAVRAHYDGTKTNSAVPRLEVLMQEFLDIDFSGENKTLRDAANSAKAEILGYKINENSFNKAAALNEFMAWTLSNAALIGDLRKRNTVLTRLVKATKILIQRIFNGKIPTDMYSHILFNTLMLSNAHSQQQINEEAVQGLIEADTRDKVNDVDPFTGKSNTEANEFTEKERTGDPFDVPVKFGQDPSIDSGESLIDDGDVIEIGDTTDGTGGTGNTGGNNTGGNGNDNGSGGVTPAARKMTNFWIERMKDRLMAIKAGTDGNKAAGLAQFKRYKEAAHKAVAKLDFGGFALSAYQKLTFRAIHMVLATEMRLNAQSGVAVNKLFEFVTENLKPEMFGPGKDGQERYATVMDLLGDTKNDEGVTDAMAVLLALSQTSDGFRAALDKLPEPDSVKVNDGSFNQVLTSLTGFLMNKAIGTVDTSQGEAKELLDVLANNLLQEDTNKEFTLLRGLMGSISKADKYLGGAMSKLAELAGDANQRMKGTERTQLTKLIVGTVAGATAFLDADRAEGAADAITKFTHMGVNLDKFVFIREFVSEVIGTNKTNAEVVQLLDRTNYAVSAIRQDYREHLPVILQDAFETHPDAEQWKTLHRIIAKLDFANLFDLANPDRGFSLLRDNSALSAQTAAKEADITQAFSRSTASVIFKKAKQLAAYMNLKGPGEDLWKNAHAINWNAGSYDANLTAAIDTLVSLYALEIADQAEKDAVTEMYDNDPEAVMNLVTYIQALNKEEDLKEFSETARLNGYKGWIPDHAKGNARVIIERDDSAEALLKKGWVRVADYTAEDEFSTVTRGYYATTVKQGGTYSQGVAQSVQGTYRGVNALTGMTVGNGASGIISDGSMKFAIRAMNNGKAIADDKEALIPVYDESGIIYLERSINPDILNKYTQPKSNLALMLGAWAGRQVEEKMAAQYNSELLIELKKIWDNRGVGDDRLFVDVSDPKLKDEIYKDSYNVLSPETKREIKVVFGEENGFMVRKDMMNVALGYRDPSIMDIWSGKTRMPKKVQTVIQAAVELIPGTKAISILSRTEEGVQSVVSNAKDLIVVRSLIVPYMNTQANVVQLGTRGVGTQEMYNGYKTKFVEIERFNENIKRAMVLRTKIALAGNDKNKRAVLQQQAQMLEDENARMSIAPLIKAGAYKNISEGITDLDVELTSGRMAEWMENQMNKLPGGIRTVAKYGLVSKDTALYKFANKAVQYGDFLAKAIYYDHLLARGLDAETAMKKVNEEFVNFSVLPGRTRQALEGVGMTWFLSFKIRTMKVALNIMRENPLRALIVAGTGIGDYGSPVNDNLASVIDQERLAYALGWTMLLGSPGMNPYVNLIEW